ncbi:protease inhibitor I9 family protein [Nonomuraea fuscirosea]|uniref:protease inhibitor I9 family protein n=1 Tax=Nonomuraea fuscirosea TaxID=1291556 RepID=UPI002DD7C2C1|nr:protease inhibitor I9 family protein [Nonomuraea fuscirosea]WSA54427.1 S8 family serine peptidase [Nonomuraea fuscirosea]
MPRRLGLPSVYLAAAVATAAATAVPSAMTPASGLALRPSLSEPARPYIVIARSRVAARDLVGEVRWRVRRYYTSALPGFATFLTAAELDDLRADRRVRSIEPDRQIRPMTGARPSRPYAVEAEGSGVTVYVVDSGVETGTETGGRRIFGDRAWRAFDATGGTGRDCGGHGTQSASRTHGVAPEAGLASVRVLGCGGSGTLSDVLAGLDWIRRHARGPAVTSMAIDGAGSPALDRAARSLVRKGVFVVGASSTGTCHVTPDGRAYSPHTPYLAGAAARHLELHPEAGPAALATWLKCAPTRAAIRQNPSRASNLLMRDGGL